MARRPYYENADYVVRTPREDAAIRRLLGAEDIRSSHTHVLASADETVPGRLGLVWQGVTSAVAKGVSLLRERMQASADAALDDRIRAALLAEADPVVIDETAVDVALHTVVGEGERLRTVDAIVDARITPAHVEHQLAAVHAAAQSRIAGEQ